ncbi:hypothetical protein XCR1_900005 [Xenorhabdus cabanillasii JM26]|uniref:Uncharacterized protein n=1 Tax=Xenorhabdus cabanillasii JM26 TaxID=1427517 RepID=W1JCF4_9GAMM|nr:hypothetical protein XCR1_900005 [Xenorhabdus cabanillasii JM26]
MKSIGYGTDCKNESTKNKNDKIYKRKITKENFFSFALRFIFLLPIYSIYLGDKLDNLGY